MADVHESVRRQLSATLGAIRDQGLHKGERVLTTPQRAHIGVAGGAQVINMCANNYLGLAEHPEVIRAAHEGLDRWGYGLSSVRFICGTQAIHKELEARLSKFLGMDDTVLYTSCFDANTGLFETLLGPEDAVISDELNHASIIDGIRLCKAQRHRYRNNDMEALEARLRDASGARTRLIATDGVFSMDGTVANLRGICDLADKYGALVMVDDSHGVGVMGESGRGAPEYHRVIERIDILTGTLGKALGGASGGYTGARQEIVDLLRQRSRPYLFSNSLAPAIVAASIKAVDLLVANTGLRNRLQANTRFFRRRIAEAGFEILPGEHPIVPIMLGDAALTNRFADRMLDRGIYVVGFSYPVVPRGKARIRTQISAAHSQQDLEFALEMFAEVKAELSA